MLAAWSNYVQDNDKVGLAQVRRAISIFAGLSRSAHSRMTREKAVSDMRKATQQLAIMQAHP